MTNTIDMNLFHDYCDMGRLRLRTAGYQDVPGESDDDALCRYLNVLNRRVPVAKRTTHQSSTLSVPASLQAGYDQLIQVSETGGDLRPYQSTLLERSAFNDLLLNDWGFQHFHMGVGPHPTKPGFQERTPPLLFAMVTDTDLYCIAIGDHSSFEDRDLLDIVHLEWPDLLPKVADKNALTAWEPTEQDIKTLRQKQINAFTTRPDGTINMGAGGGLTGNKKHSVKVMLAFTQIVKMVRGWEKAIRDEVSAKPDKYPTTLTLDLILDPTDGFLRAVDETRTYAFKLGDISLREI
ncbi:hypothetical protein ACYCVF_18315 [Bradyrhizobium sp. 1.29L]